MARALFQKGAHPFRLIADECDLLLGLLQLGREVALVLFLVGDPPVDDPERLVERLVGTVEFGQLTVGCLPDAWMIGDVLDLGEIGLEGRQIVALRAPTLQFDEIDRALNRSSLQLGLRRCRVQGCQYIRLLDLLSFLDRETGKNPPLQVLDHDVAALGHYSPGRNQRAAQRRRGRPVTPDPENQAKYGQRSHDRPAYGGEGLRTDCL